MLQLSNLRKNVWIKRGDFVVVKPIEEGDKVKAEILTILYKEQIKYLRAQGVWPAQFDAAPPTEELKGLTVKAGTDSEGEEESDNDLFQNTNR